MALAVRDEGGGIVAMLPPAPPPPPVDVAPPPPVVPSAPAFVSPSGSGDEGARGLPQQGVGAIGPIVSPVAPPPSVGPATPPPTVPGIDVPPDHRGLPQPGDRPGDVGPIVKPHGEPSPSAAPGDGGAATDGTTSSGDGEPASGGGTRTLASAGDPNDHRVSAAHAWLHFQQFFAGELPHMADTITKLRLGLPKIVG